MARQHSCGGHGLVRTQTHQCKECHYHDQIMITVNVFVSSYVVIEIDRVKVPVDTRNIRPKIQNSVTNMTSQHMKLTKPTCSLCSQSIPDVTVEVIVTGQKKTTALAEGDTGDAADDVVVAVHRQLLVRPDVEHPARRVVASSRKRISIREKLKSVCFTTKLLTL